MINNQKENRWIFGTMLVSALLSLVAALVLSVEALHLAKNPDAQLSCSINAVVNCASVMKYEDANIFGFPNSFIGMIAEPIVMTVAMAGLAGVAFPRWFMVLAQIGYGLGLIFAYYLFFLSVFVIGALCPWCLLVTLSTTGVFMSLLRYNIRQNNFALPVKMHSKLQRWFTKDYDKFATAAWLFGMFILVLAKYKDGLFG
jgi:uncharacterized membrane protein